MFPFDGKNHSLVSTSLLLSFSMFSIHGKNVYESKFKLETEKMIYFRGHVRNLKESVLDV